MEQQAQECRKDVSAQDEIQLQNGIIYVSAQSEIQLLNGIIYYCALALVVCKL